MILSGRQGRDLSLAFIDIIKAFDSVNREAMCTYLARLGCKPTSKFVDINSATSGRHAGVGPYILNDGEQSGSFNINTRVNQGYLLHLHIGGLLKIIKGTHVRNDISGLPNMLQCMHAVFPLGGCIR